MRNDAMIKSAGHLTLIGGFLGLALSSHAMADLSRTLDLATARNSGSNVSFGTVGGRSGVAILNSSYATGADPAAWVQGQATDGNSIGSGFGMTPSGNKGVGDWAGNRGAFLSDITGVSFDWYRADGTLTGGFRVLMYVYAPVDQGDIGGYLMFDRADLLPNSTAGQWNSTGNYLSGVTGVAWYSPDGSPSQWSYYKTWSEIKAALPGWSTTGVSIMNDAGYSAAIDNLTVSYVPAPGAAAVVGLAGLVGGRRRKA